jgi:hypothetical protein
LCSSVEIETERRGIGEDRACEHVTTPLHRLA